MLTVYITLFFSIAFTAGNPLREAHDKSDNSLEKEVLSDLQLLVPHENQDQQRSKKRKRNREATKELQSAKSDGPFSKIPDSEFSLDDATNYFNEPKKTIKKDLGHADTQLNESPQLSSSQFSGEENVLRRCREFLQIEHFRSQWEPIMKYPLPSPPTEDQKLLRSVCRAHLGLVSHHNLEQKLFHASSVAHSQGHSGVTGNRGIGGDGVHASRGKGSSWGDKVAFQDLDGFNLGNLGIGGQRGLAGNGGFGGEEGTAGNVGIEGNGGLAGNLGVGGKGGIVGNLGFGGNGGFFGNVGIGSHANHYLDYFSSGGLGSLLEKFFSGLHNQLPSNDGVNKVSKHYPPMNQGFGRIENYLQLGLGNSFSENELGMLGLGQAVGNAGFAGLGDITGNFALEGSEQYDNVGSLGKGGLSGNVAVGGTGGDFDNVAVAGQGDYLGNFVVEGGDRDSTGNLVLNGQGAPKFFDNALQSSSQKVARNDDSLEQDTTIRCYVGALARGGKGGQIGNLAINGGGLHYPRTGCCHSGCSHVLLVFSPKALKNGDSDLSVKSLAEFRGAESTSTSRPEKIAKLLQKFRPIGGSRSRRDWMMINSHQNDRLHQYIDHRKPWLPGGIPL